MIQLFYLNDTIKSSKTISLGEGTDSQKLVLSHIGQKESRRSKGHEIDQGCGNDVKLEES